jgi:hypothetical protein
MPGTTPTEPSAVPVLGDELIALGSGVDGVRIKGNASYSHPNNNKKPFRPACDEYKSAQRYH